jgi:archaellum biogenesis ATPase FlaH
LNPPADTKARGLLFLGPLLLSDLRAMVKNRRLARELKALMLTAEAKQARPVIVETLDLLKQQSRLERRLSQAEAVRDFMDTWRALHLIMAVIVIATMFLHVVLTRFAV